MIVLDLSRLPPLPDTIDECHREIIYLKDQLYRARQQFAQQVVERQKDGRAAKGNIKAVAAQNTELRNVINNIDFELDEFGCGFAARPRTTEDPQEVYHAVKTAMSHFHKKVAELTVAKTKRKKKTT